MLRTIVADDHTLFRAGLLRMLSDFPEVTVVAEAEDGHQVLQTTDQVAADLLILDLMMPGITGIALIEQLVAKKPDLPILVLTMHDEPATVRRVLRAGALGFITKDVAPDILRDAIATVGRRDAYVTPALATRLALASCRDEAEDSRQPLSRREQEVADLIAEGLALNQIAKRLNVSPKTITSHKANLMDKLGLRNNAELMRYVLERKQTP